MKGPRFKVAVVRGDLAPLTGGYDYRLQLSAHVLDRLNAHRVVATFRSEGPRSPFWRRPPVGLPRRLGQAGAIAAATARAAELNADDAR